MMPRRKISEPYVIADLSDMLEDTSAIAVDVGKHMVLDYQSFKNHEDEASFLRRSWRYGL